MNKPGKMSACGTHSDSEPGSKRVSQMSDASVSGDADHVEPDRSVRTDPVLCHIIQSGADDPALLFCVHRLKRISVHSGSAVLDFHEDKEGTVRRNNIDFSCAADEIPLQDPEVFPFEIRCRGIFIPAAGIPAVSVIFCWVHRKAVFVIRADLQTDRQAAVRIYKNDLIKVARWIGQGPNFRIASMCSFVP